MRVRLQGGLEKVEFWQDVREAGTRLLNEAGYGVWRVTIEPLTASIRERADVPDGDCAWRINERQKMLTLAVLPADTETEDDEAEHFADLIILETIDQIEAGPDDDDGEAE